MRVLVVVNPVAGRGSTREIWPVLRSLIEAQGVQYEVEWTSGPGHAIELSRRAADEGFTRILSVGGDGTLREVAQGAVGRHVELAVIPAGTGNDFARSVGVPVDTSDAMRVALDGTVRDLNVGRIDGSVFINVAGCGFDAEVAAMANERLTWLKGRAPYLVGAVATLFRYAPTEFTLEVDGKVLKRQAYLVCVANGRYYGGGMMIAPDAELTDDLFDVCIIGKMSRADLLRNLRRVYSGTHLSHPKVEILRGRTVVLESSRPVRCQADGELLGATPMRMSVCPDRLRFVCADGAVAAL